MRSNGERVRLREWIVFTRKQIGAGGVCLDWARQDRIYSLISSCAQGLFVWKIFGESYEQHFGKWIPVHFVVYHKHKGNVFYECLLSTMFFGYSSFPCPQCNFLSWGISLNSQRIIFLYLQGMKSYVVMNEQSKTGILLQYIYFVTFLFSFLTVFV